MPTRKKLGPCLPSPDPVTSRQRRVIPEPLTTSRCVLKMSMAVEANTVVRFAEQVKLSAAESGTLRQIYVFVEEFFRNPKFDASHDFAHVERVVGNALAIFAEEKKSKPLDPMTILLGALLHDVEDKKYLDSSTPQESAIEHVLLKTGVSKDYATRIQELVEGVSYSSEIKDPAKVQRLINETPELAIVQDADRIDAIGAIGIARCFTFAGAKGVRSIGDSIQHFRDKLLKLEGMMKTSTGKQMAAQRSQRLRDFMDWWQAEIGPRDYS